ncbi:MAG TPA: AMP-binding protein, partial [Syntrophorhabdales bacterium]|nr:AMP-binding protein [Syntrophorhabdales bacterium]
MLEGFVPYPEAFIKRYREKGLWLDRTVGEELDNAVGRYGDRIALACEGRHVTYRELGIRAARLALHFIELGLKPYDRIVFQLPNELEFAYCFYAAMKIGAIPIMS